MRISYTNLLHLLKSEGVPYVSNPKSFHTSVKEVVDLSIAILPAISNALNKLHSTNFSERYWHILIGPWLMQSLSVIYDHNKIYSSLLTYCPQQIKYLCCDLSVSIPFDSYSSLKLPELDEFNLQTLSFISLFHRGSPSASVDRLLGNSNVYKYDTPRTVSLKKRIYTFLSSFLRNNQTYVSTPSAIPIKDQLRYFLAGIPIIPILPSPINECDLGHSVDKSARKLFHDLLVLDSAFDSGNEYIATLLALLIPMSYVENYPFVCRQSSSMGRPPRVIFLSTEMYTRYEPFMSWVASCAEQGTMICSMQHGGNYGIEFFSEKVFIELIPYDIFYSWGWKWQQYKSKDPSNIIPMPSFFLKEYNRLKSFHKCANYILFTSTAIPSFSRRFICSHANSYLSDQYFESQSRFYSSLNNHNQSITKVRLYPDSSKQTYEYRWLSSYPDVQFDDCPLFESSVVNSMLCVTDTLTTAWLESISANRPTVVFINKSLYNLTNEFLVVLDSLHYANIIHYSPEAAAVFVNSVILDLDSWWKSDIVVNAIEDLNLLNLNYKTESIFVTWKRHLKTLS